jgi:hypothetical protein
MPSAFFCFGNRYATSESFCKPLWASGAADMLRATFLFRLDGLSAATASSSFLFRFFSPVGAAKQQQVSRMTTNYLGGRRKNQNQGMLVR